jgi:hypothetical protein
MSLLLKVTRGMIDFFGDAFKFVVIYRIRLIFIYRRIEYIQIIKNLKLKMKYKRSYQPILKIKKIFQKERKILKKIMRKENISIYFINLLFH